MAENKKINKKWLAVMITALIVAAVCVGILIFYSVGSKMSQDEKNKYTSTTVQNTSTTQKVNPIDFTELKKTNSDIVGWIKIDNTDIDNPILRPDTEDDSYYLDHTYKQEYSSAGAIYMEKKNSGEFSDSVTVLYGHNWKNNGYFRPLYNFKDKDFFDKNEYIYVYKPGHILKYRIYAAYQYDNRHILNSFDFSNETVLTDYFESTLDPTSIIKNVREGVTLDKDSKILTLSTCVEGNKSARYLVQAVLVDDEETA